MVDLMILDNWWVLWKGFDAGNIGGMGRRAKKSEGEAKFPLDNFPKKRRMVRVFWKK